MRGKGWTKAQELQVGDEVRLLEPGWAIVEAVSDTGRLERVYNLEIEDDHTYFVGCDEWGFAVWAHNNGCGPELSGEILAKDVQYQLMKRQYRLQELRAKHGDVFRRRMADATEQQLVQRAGLPQVLTDEALVTLRSRIVSGEQTVLSPNARYRTPDGSVHTTDGQGRLARTSFALNDQSVNPSGTRVATEWHTTPLGEPASGVPGDIGFHLRADILQGSPFYPNLVPGQTTLNNRAFKSLEGKWRAAAEAGHPVGVSIVLEYGSGSNLRPTAFDVRFRINGMPFQRRFPNAVTGSLDKAFKASVKSAYE